MDWIKRNLYFLIGGAIALALMGMAGWFLFSKWQLNKTEMARLNEDYAELDRLNAANPHPGGGKVNNIAIAKAQEQEVRALVEKAKTKFVPIPRIPDMPEVSDRDFSAALSRTVDQLQKTATNSSVILPPNYLFSFSAQNARVTFATNSLNRLAEQLGEVKTICEVLYRARVNTLDNVRRERVSTDDQGGNLTDYFADKKSVTNELAIVSPYEISFRSFSAELAAVLSGFASSPHGIIVKGMNVETVPAPAVEEQQAPVTPIYVPVQQETRQTEASSAAAFQRRYGIRGGAANRYGTAPTPAPAPQQVYVPPAAQPKTGPQPVVNERQLKVTVALNIVKLVTNKPEGAPTSDAGAQASATQQQ